MKLHSVSVVSAECAVLFNSLCRLGPFKSAHLGISRKFFGFANLPNEGVLLGGVGAWAEAL
jgi:hypothetical protein